MENKIAELKKYLRQVAARREFVHHRWFVKWHLEIVAKTALELCDYYPQADRQMVEVMAWLHDYGKMVDFDTRYDRAHLDAARDKLVEIGFDRSFADKVADYIELVDKKMEVDLREAPIEVQIVSSADGCSHLVGPFMHLFWHEATDKTFTNKTLDELMELNKKKAEKDWTRKIVLPEARRAFAVRHQFLLEQSGNLPPKFL